MENEVKDSALTPEQQKAIVELGGMFLMAYKDEFIWNMTTNEELSPRDYVNDVLATVGIAARFMPPKPERDLGTLLAVNEAGEPLPGKVTRALEMATRSDPTKLVEAAPAGGWWGIAARPGGAANVMVRVVAKGEA